VRSARRARAPLLGREELALSEPNNCPEPENPIDEQIAEVIRWKAQSLVGRAGLTRDDCPDVEQELAMRLLAPLQKFNRAKLTRRSYAQMLVDRLALNLLRDRQVAKRAGGPLAPLPAELPDECDGATAARALDVAEALARLPDRLREVAELLKTETIAGVARALGVSRATVYARVRELRDRTEFRELGEIP
jgi:DNA-directed RNA polymerase specialized sigma24 family protein